MASDSVRERLNVAGVVQDVTAGQHGYFTRAQAITLGLRDAELARAVEYGQVERLDVGVYRLIGAPHDAHEDLRVAWLRLTPDVDPFDRLHRPEVWVAGASAARVWGLGDIPADTPEFISTRRLQPRFDVRVAVRTAGLGADGFSAVDGFPVQAVPGVVGGLVRAGVDGGHVGKVAADAIRRGLATPAALQRAIGSEDLDALIGMAATG